MSASIWIWVGLATVGCGVALLGYAQKLIQHAELQDALEDDQSPSPSAFRTLTLSQPVELHFADEWTLVALPEVEVRETGSALAGDADVQARMEQILRTAVARVSWSPLADGPAPDRDLATYLLQQLVEPMVAQGLEPTAIRLEQVQVMAELEAPTVPLGDGRQWVLGREGDLVVDGPGVSRRHLLIREEGGQWMVMDLGSANGTWVRGQRLTPNVPVVVNRGELVMLGRETPVDLSHMMT